MTTKMYASKKVIIMTFVVILAIALVLLLNYGFKDRTIPVPDDMYLAMAPNSYSTAIKKSAPAVVSIQTTKDTNAQQNLGSGVIVDTAGHILTNYHVIKDTQVIRVKLADGRKTTAQIIGVDSQTDLAVLQIKVPQLPVVYLGSSAQLQVGDVVLAIGNPLGLNNTVTQGIVSSLASLEYEGMLNNLIQTDAAINLGNSGGALIDTQGRMIGINTAIVSNIAGGQGIGFAIPSDLAKDIMGQLITHGKIIRGWLGTQLSDIPDETRQYLKFQQSTGIYVQDTIRNSPAQKAGILPGDIITRINNESTENVHAAISLISSLKPEQTYPLEIFRHGKKVVYNVVVKERP